MRALRFAVIAGLAGWAGPALAHATGGAPGNIPGWTWDPTITLPLGLSGAVFGCGWWRLHGRSDRGAVRLRGRLAWFVFGWLVLAGAVVSPLHEGGERSFTLHMIEHELLMLVAAPALALSRPLAIMLWALPAPMRQGMGRIAQSRPIAGSWRALTAPVTATLLQAAVLWVWHAPALFDLALARPGWHAAQHLSFLVGALLFWTAMAPDARAGNAARALAALCLFATSIVSGALGALMALSNSPWYARYARIGMAPLGMTPAEDQQIAGLVMWIPGGLFHAAVALWIVRALLRPRDGGGAYAV